jgi:hypothetical protein
MMKLFAHLSGHMALRIHIPEVLETMPDEFDSHEFIAAFAYQNQLRYVSSLQEAGWSKPIQTINDAIVHWLAESGLVQQIGTRESENMFKQMVSTAVWRKVA